MLPNLKLKNPPIKEALISIAFTHPIGTKQEDLYQFCDITKVNYPNKENEIENTVKIENNGSVTKSTEYIGYMLTSPDTKKHIKLHFDSISFHRVEPYENWEQLVTEAKYYLSELQNLFPDIKIKQISVRYINVLGIKFKEGDVFEDYLTLLPAIPESITKVIEGYFMQIKIPDLSKNINSVVTEFFKYNDDLIEITLDINVIKNLESVSISSIWNLFDDLRVFKNKIFFNSITEKTKNLYDA